MSSQDHLTVHQRGRHGEPLNAEDKEASSSFITPIPHLFHRNHDDIIYEPSTPATYDEWRVSLGVDEDVIREQGWPLSASQTTVKLVDLMGDEHEVDVTAALECAGNRREELSESEHGKAEGIQWKAGVISNAVWSGASVRSMLLRVGVADPYAHHADPTLLVPSEESIAHDAAAWSRDLHLHLLSSQPSSESDRPAGEHFGASVPLATAMHPNQACLLAWKHNGAALLCAHGFPLRAVVPGHAGARWVKWLSGMRVSKLANDSPPMRLDYKIIEPPSEGEKAWRDEVMGVPRRRKEIIEAAEPLQRLGIGSAIDELVEGQALQLGGGGRGGGGRGSACARGYAVGQDGSPVSVVEYIFVADPGRKQASVADLRNAADAKGAEAWAKATTVQTSDQPSGDQQPAARFSWAWSIWHTDLPCSLRSAMGDEGVDRYALIVRATTQAGAMQEKESPWNIRGFKTRSWPVVRGLSLS